MKNICVITGATGGIGSATAKKWVKLISWSYSNIRSSGKNPAC